MTYCFAVKWAGHVARMDDSLIPQKAVRERFGRRMPLGELRGRWENAVWRDAIDLLHIQYWKVATKREGWRKEIGEAMAR
jgi:hypothetical protein